MSEKGTMSKAEQNNLFTAFAGYAYLSYEQGKIENSKRVAALYLWLSSDKFRKPEDEEKLKAFKEKHKLTEFDGKIPPLDNDLVKKLKGIIKDKNNPNAPAFLAADMTLRTTAEEQNLFQAFATYAYLSHGQDKKSKEEKEADENNKRVMALYLWLSSDKFRKPEDEEKLKAFKEKHELTEFDDGKIPPLDDDLVTTLGGIIEDNPNDPAFLAADTALSEITEERNLFEPFADYASRSYGQDEKIKDVENRKRVAALYLWLSSNKFCKLHNRALRDDFKERLKKRLTEFDDGKIPPLDGALVKKLGDIIKEKQNDPTFHPAFSAAADELSEIAKDNEMSEKEYVTVSKGMFVDKNRSLAIIYKNPALQPLLHEYTTSFTKKAETLCAYYIQTSDQPVLLVPPETENTPQKIAQLEKELQDDLYKILYLLDWHDKKDKVIPRDFEKHLKTEEGQRGLNDFKEKNPQFSDYNGILNEQLNREQQKTTIKSPASPNLDPDTTSLIGENGPLTTDGIHHVTQTVIPSYQLLDILSLGKLSDVVFKITGASWLIERSGIPKLAGKLTVDLSAKIALSTKALATLLKSALTKGVARQATIAATATTAAATTVAPTGGTSVPVVAGAAQFVSTVALVADVIDLGTDIYHEITTTSDKLAKLKLSLPQVWTRTPPSPQIIPNDVLKKTGRTTHYSTTTRYRFTFSDPYDILKNYDPKDNKAKRPWAVDEYYVGLLLQKKFITEHFPDRSFDNRLLSPSLQSLSGKELDKFLEEYAPGALDIYKNTLKQAEPKLNAALKIPVGELIKSESYRGYHQLPLFSTQQSETKAKETIEKYLRHLDAINNGQIKDLDYPDLKTEKQVREAMKKDLADQTLQILKAKNAEERKAEIERLQRKVEKDGDSSIDTEKRYDYSSLYTGKRLEEAKKRDAEINEISAEIERLQQKVKTAKGSDLADAEQRLEEAKKRDAELNRFPQYLIDKLTSDVLTAYKDLRKSMRDDKLNENFETTLSNIHKNILDSNPEVLEPSCTNFAVHNISLTENDPNYIPRPWLTDFSDYTDEELLTTYATKKNLQEGEKDAIRFELFLRNPHYVSYSPDTSYTAEDIQLLRTIQAYPDLLPEDFYDKIRLGAGGRIPLKDRYKINRSPEFARGIKSEQINKAMGRILSAYQKTMNTEPPPEKLETISTLIVRYSAATHGTSLKPLKGVFDYLKDTVPKSDFFGLADWISGDDWDTYIQNAQDSIENASETPLAFPAEIVGRFIDAHRGGQPVNPLQLCQYYAKHPLRPTVEVEFPNAELFVEAKEFYTPGKLPEGAQYFSYVPQRRGQKIRIPSREEIATSNPDIEKTGPSVTKVKEPPILNEVKESTVPDLFLDIVQFLNPKVTDEKAREGWGKLDEGKQKFMLEQNKMYIEALKSRKPGTTKGKILESFLESQYVQPTAPEQQSALESQYVQPTAPEQPVSAIKNTLRKTQVREEEPKTTAQTTARKTSLYGRPTHHRHV